MNRSPRDEASWINFISSKWRNSGAEVSIGDDACVIPVASYSVTTDAILEGIDFMTSWAPPRAVGYKALAVNLSDLAAMGASPIFFLLTLCIPETLPDSYVEGVIEGIKHLSDREGVTCCGGDLSSSISDFVISITLFGEVVHKPLLRSGGRVGDYLFVSDTLGAPAEALRRFREGDKLTVFDPALVPVAGEDVLLDRFFRPPSQCELGKFLAGEGLATCAMDISDGLSLDLHRLCKASGAGAEIEEETLPVDPLLAGLSPADSLDRVLYGGEEQVLLFGVDPAYFERVRNSPFSVRCVGRLVKRPGVVLVFPDGRHEKLVAKGFDHFDR